MALVSSAEADLRIFKPSFACEYSSREEDSDHRSRLLAKIHGAYCKALERLDVSRRPRVAARFRYGGGLCLGLLDPASNIIANTLVPGRHDAQKGSGEAELEDLERRSLDGMVTFLTRFFPYLAESEALLYLHLAGADLLVAARIVVMDRRMRRFGSSEPAVEEALRMALKCAALAARHPDADRLVGTWLAISARLDKFVRLLAKDCRRCPSSSLGKITKLLDGPVPLVDDLVLIKAWQLAAPRPPCPRTVPFQNTSTGIKRVLLDAIRGFYLQALARLPAGRFHHSLAKAGHCYGPLDPVSNIIINTIWYDKASSPAMEVDLDMVSTLGLHRIETRSMYGLVSFLCTRYQYLNFHQAVCRLLEADGNLLLADPNIDAAGFHDALDSRVDTQAQGPATSVNLAFKAAAAAAWHPNPDDQATLLTSCKAMLGSAVALLQDGGQLSSEDVQRLGRLLVTSEESPCAKSLIPSPVQDYAHKHARISKMIHTALNVYASTSNGVSSYELHAICGVNEQVSGPVYCPENGACPPEKFYQSHVNFLATPKGTHSHDDRAPVLFFAEINNDDGEPKTQPFCCPVRLPPPCAERVRCLYCDYMGTRIVHPVGKNFHGREDDFEKMVCGEDPYDDLFDPALMPQYYTNMSIISYSSVLAERIGRLEEDRETDEDSDSDYSSDE